MLRRLPLSLFVLAACWGVQDALAQERIVPVACATAPAACAPQACAPQACAPQGPACSPCPSVCDPCGRPSVRLLPPVPGCNSCERRGIRLGFLAVDSCDSCDRPRLSLFRGSRSADCGQPACSAPKAACSGCTLGAPIPCDPCPRPSIRLGFSSCDACTLPTIRSCSKPACPQVGGCVPCSKPAIACRTCAPAAKIAPAPTSGCASATAPQAATCGCKDSSANCGDACTGERHRPLLSLLRRIVGRSSSNSCSTCTNPTCTNAPVSNPVNNQGERIVPVPDRVPPMPPASNLPIRLQATAPASNALPSLPQLTVPQSTVPQTTLPSSNVPFQAQPVAQPGPIFVPIR